MTHPLLDELQSTFVLRHFQQLHCTSLIGCKATDFPDHVTHKLGVFGQALWEEREDAGYKALYSG